MIKLITPPGMLLTVALLAIYSAYAFLIGSIEGSWALLSGGIASVLACYGTAMLRPWSRYLVYALAIGFVAKLAQSIVDAIRAGYFGYRFASSEQALWSLAPSLAMVALSCLCCYFVYRHFRAAQRTFIAPVTVPVAPHLAPVPVPTPSIDA